MKRYNEIVLPGGLFVRSLKALVNGGGLYEYVLPEKMEFTDSEFIEVKGICDNDKIIRMFKGLEEFAGMVSVYLHGSWADNTRTPFSDIDDFVVIDDYSASRKDLRKIIRLLNQVDMAFCRIDPLQHHGHWLVSKSELANYDNSFLPLFILKDSLVVLGNSRVEARLAPRKTLDGLRCNVRMTCENIQKLFGKLYHEQCISMYELKMLVGSFALMPAFIFQLHGREVSKPLAIQNAYEYYTEASLMCIGWASDCRANWGELTEKGLFKLYKVWPCFFSNPHLWRSFGTKMAPSVKTVGLSGLSRQVLGQDCVDKFIAESLSYARE